MKAKLKAGLLVMVMILNMGLLNANLEVNKYSENKSVKEKANYIEVAKAPSKKEEPIIESKVEIEELQSVETDPIVYDGLTLNELSDKLNRSLNSTISGKGYLIASHSLELGVDPYMALAIILQETGCKWDCSYLVKSCNNVGGQKGSGCSGYSYFNSIDEGIVAFIDNLYNNYISKNLLTPELINPIYAEDQTWSQNVNAYIEIIKAQ